MFTFLIFAAGVTFVHSVDIDWNDVISRDLALLQPTETFESSWRGTGQVSNTYSLDIYNFQVNPVSNIALDTRTVVTVDMMTMSYGFSTYTKSIRVQYNLVARDVTFSAKAKTKRFLLSSDFDVEGVARLISYSVVMLFDPKTKSKKSITVTYNHSPGPEVTVTGGSVATNASRRHVKDAVTFFDSPYRDLSYRIKEKLDSLTFANLENNFVNFVPAN